MLNRVIGSAFWNVGATLAQLVLQLVVLAMLGRLLTPEEFGLVGIATAITAFAGLLGQLGIGQALIQRRDLDDSLVRTGFTVSLAAGTLVSVLVAALAVPLANAFNEPRAAPFIALVAVSIVAQALGSVADALLQREMRFREVGGITVASYLAGYVFVALPLALLGFGAWSLAFAFVVQSLTKTILSLVRRPHAVTPVLDAARFRRLLSFGSRVTVSKLLNTLALQGDNLIVARALGPVALGIYSRSYQLMLIPVQLVGQTMSSVLYPSLSQVQGRREALREAYLAAAGVATLLGGTAAALFVPLAPEIIRLVIGPGWEEAILPLRVLSAVVVLRVAYKLDDTLAKATAALNARLLRDVVYGCAIVVGVLIGVRWGLAGAAAAVGFAIVLNHALGVSMSLRLTGTSLRDYLGSQRATFVLVPLALTTCQASRWLLGNATDNALVVIVLATLTVALLLMAIVLALPTVLATRQRTLITRLAAVLPANHLSRFIVARLTR